MCNWAWIFVVWWRKRVLERIAMERIPVCHQVQVNHYSLKKWPFQQTDTLVYTLRLGIVNLLLHLQWQIHLFFFSAKKKKWLVMMVEIISQLQFYFRKKYLENIEELSIVIRLSKIVVVHYCGWRWLQKFQLDADSSFLKSIQPIKWMLINPWECVLKDLSK